MGKLNCMTHFTSDDLILYLFGELPEADLPAMQFFLQEHPEKLEELRTYRETLNALPKACCNPPDALLNTILAQACETDSNTLSC